MGVLQVRVDDELKNQATAIFEEMGMDLSTAVRMFLKRSIIEGGIPFATRYDEVTLKAIKAVEEIRKASEENGNCDMTLDEINEEIRLARLEREEKKKKQWSSM